MSKPQPDTIQEIITAIQFSQRFLVATHIRPDGDAIGSVLAMTHMLHHLGKQADPYCNDPVPVALPLSFGGANHSRSGFSAFSL